MKVKINALLHDGNYPSKIDFEVEGEIKDILQVIQQSLIPIISAAN